MKTRLLIQSVTICSLFLSCAEAPEYTPRQPVTSTTGTNQGATKTPSTSDAQKTAESKDTSTMTPQTPTATPTPTPTPTPSASPVPNPSAGVVATGKTLLMQSCTGACHVNGGMPGTPIDARTSDALSLGKAANPAHAAPDRTAFFDKPAAGAPATAHSHVAAYLEKTVGKLVLGPNLPDPNP
jgi:hypothetical protein